jgi:hypothetical protein
MDSRWKDARQAAEALKALDAARAKRMHRAEEAVRERKAAPGPHDQRLPRAEVKLAVAVLGAGGEPVYGWARNVSEGGCFVACDRALPVGTACTVRLSLPPEAGGGRLETAATVARSGEDGMGLAFADLSPEAADALARLVAAYDLTLG